MSLCTKLKVGQTIIPTVPFLWYREEEMVCPIEYISQLSITDAQKLYSLDIYTAPYIVIQRHICDTANIYVCLHSLLYYTLHPTEKDLLILPNSYRCNMPFTVTLYPLNDTKIIEIGGGLKTGDCVQGSVFIHDSSFSPPGCLHFKVDNTCERSEFVCIIKCPKLDLNIACLFVLFHDLQGSNIDLAIANTIANL